MANVWEAMKKHEAELAAKAGPEVQQDGLATVTDQSDAPAGPGAAEGAVATAIVDAPQAPAPVREPGPRPAEAGNGDYSELILTHHDRGGAIAEAFRSLRINLLAQRKDRQFCFVVTSADPGEGKTVTCANLAVIMAELEEDTIVVDGDLRKAGLAPLFGAPNTPGVADLLRGEATLEQIIQRTAHKKLFLIPAGNATTKDVGEFLSRPSMEEMINQLRKRYDYVLFDTPPINRAPDAGNIGRIAGEALVVVQMNKTRKESVRRTIRLLDAANVKVDGIILTHHTFVIPHYVYRYS